MTDQADDSGAQLDGDERTEDAGTPDTSEPQNGSESPKGNREARYRVERNEAREALSTAQTRIEAMQIREVERLAAEHLAQPADLMSLGGVALADLLTEAGDVDDAAVAEAVSALIESRPGLSKHPRDRAVDPSQGSGSGLVTKASPGWADLFKK